MVPLIMKDNEESSIFQPTSLHTYKPGADRILVLFRGVVTDTPSRSLLKACIKFLGVLTKESPSISAENCHTDSVYQCPWRKPVLWPKDAPRC